MGSVITILTIPISICLGIFSASPSDIKTFCKWIISYSYIEFCRRTGKRRFDLYDMEAKHDPEKLNFLPPQIEYDLESPQPESKLLHSDDEVFFYGVNSSSECLITRIARKTNNEAEAWIYLKLKEGKIYRLAETSAYQNSCSDKREFTCGGLRVNYMQPMRQWRIFYNGILRETSETDERIDRMVYVKFALIWRASSDCFDATTDGNSSALAKGFARSKWKAMKPSLKELNDALNFYAQSGNIIGTVQVCEDTEERIFNVFGEKVRFLDNASLKNGVDLTHILGHISKTGAIFHVVEATIPGVVDRVKLGFVVFPSGVIAPISNADILIENPSSEKNGTRAHFYADGLEFKVNANLLGKTAHFESETVWGGSLTIDALKIRINDELDGRGVLLKRKILKTSQRWIIKEIINKIPKVVPMAVHFSENICEISEVTGGKGSSLGKLTQLSQHYLQNFIVPNGMVVTTSAYDAFLNEDIRKGIKNLEDVLYGNTPGDVKEACQRVMDEVTKANMPDQVLQAVVTCLQKAFGDSLLTKKFAVRSSATGEDTEQMSAAGQMDTFLGVTGLDEIMSAVKKCWASQFGFVAAQYKRQNGQIINSPMAVVIQEMVSCDVAGVLFTCDPLTGNPTLMSITANYGLGESVVSGSEEPDTIILSRNIDDQLEIKEKIIGAKSHRIVIKDGKGTTLEDVSEQEKKSCCLSDSTVLRLGNIAVQIEKSYRSSRDIEWGFWNDNVYILQSRPITSGTCETEFEIDHETDAPMRLEDDYFSMCNVGEVLPGALSVLGMDVMLKFFRISFQRKSTPWRSLAGPFYFPKRMCSMYRHVMFYIIDMFDSVNEGKGALEATMVGLFGRVIEDENLYLMAMERYGRKKKRSAIKRYFMLLTALFSPPISLKQALKTYANYHVPVENQKNSQEMFKVLMNACDDLHEAFFAHMTASGSSMMWNMIVLNILQKAKGGMNSEVYRDFSKLLSAIQEVESADVPSSLQSLAYHIGKDIKSTDFKKMTCEEIAQWLNTSSTEAGIKYREFLSKHGHRCLREVDIRSTTWGADPTLLIELLKNLVGNVKDASAKKQGDSDKIVADLKLRYIQRLALKKFLLPRCRRSVQQREATKSLFVKAVDDWRKGYWHFAKTMVSEGRIPDADLIFFMPLEEIKEILSTRSPKIIARANHRRRRHPVLDKYIFPEISKGFPQPVNINIAPILPAEDNFMMKGIPVSQGVAKGYVRVAMTLEEASLLKPGEILLTYSTDIGWTPYFPFLAGVVTELGGLISHGAVVSREYGLPCIVGLHGATRQFQTGDYVLLDGNKGILQKISPPQM